MTKARTYPRRGLHGAVVHDIGVRIVKGELKAGDALPTEEELSGELAVSRTVLREAIKVLAAKRLVESRPKTGTRVRPRHDWNLLDPDVLAWQLEAGPDRRFLDDALELRRLIEPQAARLAAQRASDHHVAALEDAREEMVEAGEDMNLFMEPDLRFHALLLEACDNEVLEHMLDIVGAVLRTLFTVSSRPPGHLARAAQLHGAIVDAVRARNPDAAEEAVLLLLDDTAKNVERAFGASQS
jgi:DNA-binding FadR family transcriptional regulator